MEIKWLERYKGTKWHRLKMGARGATGLFPAVILTVATVLYCILEIGNRAWDVMLMEVEE